ncbi:MAG: ABC transporter permease, partial [Bacillota bacterium]
MKINVNYDIALTHILTRKKQTIVAALGVTVGIALYIFSNSIVVGVNNYSKLNMFKTMPHIRIHKEDEISVPIVKNGSTGINLISNPKIISYSKSIINPDGLIEALKKQKFIINAAPQVNVEL